MSIRATRIKILGTHPWIPTAADFEEAQRLIFGESSVDDEAARRRTEDHFAGLYLVEIEVDLPAAEIEWSEITQRDEQQSRSNWQVAYDERMTGVGRWAFFFHDLNSETPLETQLGRLALPDPTPLPARLNHIKYEVP